MTLFEILDRIVLPALLTGGSLLLSAIATVHVLLYKEQSRAVWGWLGVIWLVPYLGVTLYGVMGINRIHRKALQLRGGVPRLEVDARPVPACAPHPGLLPDLAVAVGQITRLPLTGGNRIGLLQDGDAAYPVMLDAIDGARHTISLCTYIFDVHKWGLRFVDALARAQERGVEVRVLVDGVGDLYGWPPAVRVLKRRGVDARSFLWSLNPLRMAYLNLRNHRKVMVVDGQLGFTGGMNIRDAHVLADAPRQPTADLHFRVEGPVVRQLQQVFALDWAFTAGEHLRGPGWFPALDPCGTTLARAIPDGPDEHLEATQWTVIAALACAERVVHIVTPYFLPEEELIGVINATALRGVTVNIILPARNNLEYLTWATAAELGRLLAWGVRVWLTPGPFDHSKLVVVDGKWVLFGSANLDPRSLRLNFELGVECYDEDLGRACESLCLRRIAGARRVTLAEIEGRPLPIQLRDGIARLFKPYL